MPELPEVERARRLIADEALHRRIVDVNDTDTFVARPHAPGQIKAALVGRELTAAHRRGKTMWLDTSGPGGLADPDADPDPEPGPGPELGIHLGMSGSIIVITGDERAEGGEPHWQGTWPRNPRWERFALEFADGGRLVLSDPRRLGRIRLDPDVSALGPDALEVSREQFRGLIMKGRIAVKARLLDQSKISGVGNLLADEALWQAKLSPSAPVDTLTRAEVDRLYEALRGTLEAAVASGGAHTGDVISARHEGARCPRCGAEMRHGVVGGRSTWWCSREQAPRRPARRRSPAPQAKTPKTPKTAKTAGRS
ncbi:MAG TPA: DNA-formamidopyrimidine glycosylase family protein [Streptosporangiaceae bacterium]|nr:DNA-formamidopyrimidine glycosylase family protein [Streptosporangiaceae bacterium]